MNVVTQQECMFTISGMFFLSVSIFHFVPSPSTRRSCEHLIWVKRHCVITYHSLQKSTLYLDTSFTKNPASCQIKVLAIKVHHRISSPPFYPVNVINYFFTLHFTDSYLRQLKAALLLVTTWSFCHRKGITLYYLLHTCTRTLTHALIILQAGMWARPATSHQHWLGQQQTRRPCGTQPAPTKRFALQISCFSADKGLQLDTGWKRSYHASWLGIPVCSLSYC